MKTLIAQSIQFYDSKLSACVNDFSALILRVVIGLIFIPAGYGKLTHLDRTIEYFMSLGIPMAQLQAPLAAVTEFLCGLLVFTGTFGRLAAFPLIPVMGVAILTAKKEEIDGFSSGVMIPEFLIMIILVGIIALGSGRISIDRFLSRLFTSE